METKHVFVALGAGFAVGAVGAYVYRHLDLDPEQAPLPLLSKRSPGTINAALEIDPVTKVTKVRTVDAARILKALEGRELEPLPDTGRGEQASFSTMKMLDPKLPVNASTSAWLALAAKAGFDVLIDERLTAMAKGNGVQGPAGWDGKSPPTDIVICRKADTAKFATFPSGVYAVLVWGDAAGSGAFPAPPNYLASAPGSLASTATDATKQAEATIKKEIAGRSWLPPYFGNRS